MNIAHYAKSIMYIGLAVVGVLVTSLTDDVVTQSELINVGIVGVGAVATYLVPNLDAGPAAYLKGAVAFLVAGGVALQSFLTDGVSTAEWLQIAVAAFAGIGVVIVPNEPKAGVARHVVNVNYPTV